MKKLYIFWLISLIVFTLTTILGKNQLKGKSQEILYNINGIIQDDREGTRLKIPEVILPAFSDIERLEIDFKFIQKAPTGNRGNIFQTADGTNALRLEVDVNQPAYLVARSVVTKTEKVFKLTDSIAANQIYDFKLSYLTAGMLTVKLNELVVLDVKSSEVEFKLSEPFFGAGIGRSHSYFGKISDLKIKLAHTFSYYRLFRQVSLTIFLFLSISIVLEFFSRKFRFLEDILPHQIVLRLFSTGISLRLSVLFSLVGVSYLFHCLYGSYIHLMGVAYSFLAILFVFFSDSRLREKFHFLMPTDAKSAGHATQLNPWITDRSGMIAAFVIGTFFFLVTFHYSINLPYWDDYFHSFPLIKSADELSFSAFQKILFNRFMEHMTLGLNLVIFVVYKIFGHFYLWAFYLLGTLFLLGFLALIFLSIDKNQRSFFMILPSLLLILQFQYSQIITWPTNYAGVFVFIFGAFASLFSINRAVLKNSNLWFLLAILLGLFANFSFGSGFLILLLGFFLTIYRNHFRFSLLWLAGMSFGLFQYFSEFSNPVEVTVSLSAYAAFFFAFIGSTFTLGIFAVPGAVLSDTGVLLAQFGGALVLLGFAYLTFKKFYQKNPVVFCFLIFLFASAILATRQRGYVGIDQAFQSRYHLYSGLIISLIVLGILQQARELKTYLNYGILGTCLLINLGSVPLGISSMSKHANNLVYGFYLSYYLKPAPIGANFSTEQNAYFAANYDSLKDAINSGIVVLPLFEMKNWIGSKPASPPLNAEIFPSEQFSVNKNPMFIQVTFSLKNGDCTEEPRVILKGEKTESYFQPRQISKINASWNLFKHYFPTPETYLALIPRPEQSLSEFKIGVVCNSSRRGELVQLTE